MPYQANVVGSEQRVGSDRNAVGKVPAPYNQATVPGSSAARRGAVRIRALERAASDKYNRKPRKFNL